MDVEIVSVLTKRKGRGNNCGAPGRYERSTRAFPFSVLAREVSICLQSPSFAPIQGSTTVAHAHTLPPSFQISMREARKHGAVVFRRPSILRLCTYHFCSALSSSANLEEMLLIKKRHEQTRYIHKLRSLIKLLGQDSQESQVKSGRLRSFRIFSGDSGL